MGDQRTCFFKNAKELQAGVRGFAYLKIFGSSVAIKSCFTKAVIASCQLQNGLRLTVHSRCEAKADLKFSSIFKLTNLHCCCKAAEQVF